MCIFANCTNMHNSAQSRMRLVLSILLLIFQAAAEDLPITGISHVAFRVSDLPKARAFYTGVLGLPEAFTLGNTHFMKVNDEQYIEVQLGPPAEGTLRMTHISLVTSSVEKLHAILLDRGLHPADLKPAGADGNRSFRLTDPDGNIIEFTQYLRGSLHSNARGKFNDAVRISNHLQHAGFPVNDLHAAIAWYRDKLGFVRVFPGDPAKPELPLANMRMPGPGGDYIELISEPDSAQHACFEVPDIQAAHKLAVARGTAAQAPQIGRTLRWLFNIYDPDRSRVEFIEPAIAAR
jgi:catechol 2,3-dioxygenase-like lactoylglutathione lyase family enzyme